MPVENNLAVLVVQLSYAPPPLLILQLGYENLKARLWYHVAADTVCPPKCPYP